MFVLVRNGKRGGEDAPAKITNLGLWIMSVFGFPIAEVEPPGPVDNTQLLQLSSGGEKVNLVEGALFRKLSPATWKYFLHIYGGGPTIVTTMDALQ